MNNRSLCIVTLLPPHGNTGVQTHIQAARELARTAGLQNVDVITPYGVTKAVRGPLHRLSTVLAHCNREYGIIAERNIQYVLLYQQLRALAAATKSKWIIYAQDPLSAKAALRLRRVLSSVDVVLIVHFNISESWELIVKGIARKCGALDRYHRALEAEVLARVDRLVFVSEFIKATVLGRNPDALTVPSWVVPNLVKRPGPKIGSESKGDLITIGTLEPRKNQPFLVRVLAEAHRLGHRYRLAVIGDGDGQRRLKKLVHEFELEDYVTFHGYVPNAADLISCYRVYVHAAIMESFGIALVEALARGKPVFAAPVGGLNEIFDDGVEGIYWNLEDTLGAARGLIQVLEDEELYQKLSMAARRRYDRQFDPAIVGPRLLEAVTGQPTVTSQARKC